MKTNVTTTAVCLGAILWMTAATAGEVDVPNVFQSGAPARAAEVNANFAAVELAVDDNAQTAAANAQAIADNAQAIDANGQAIDANSQTTADNAQGIADNATAIAELATGLTQAGVAVTLDDAPIGRYLGHGRPPVEIDLEPLDTGTVLLAEAVGLGNTDLISVLSPTGYRFAIATSDMEEPTELLGEGVLRYGPVFFDDATCSGNPYFPVEGDTGFFTGFTLGNGQQRPAKAWAMRQGVVWASPDPNDPNPAYMIRQGQTVQTVPLLSLLVWAPALDAPFCIDATTIPGFDINDPLHVNNTAFAAEPNDAMETGVTGRLGGEIGLR